MSLELPVSDLKNHQICKFGQLWRLPEAKPDLQVEVCETLGAESVDLWPARYFQKSNQYAYLHINRNNEAGNSLNAVE